MVYAKPGTRQSDAINRPHGKLTPALFELLTSSAMIVFNDPHKVVGIFWRDLCDDFSFGNFVLGAGMA
jgi:hypothetical protein